MGTKRSRVLNILIALDQLLWTVITLGKGDPDETISAAAYRNELKSNPVGRYGRIIIDSLASFFEDNHCQRAYAAELMRTQTHKHYRDPDVIKKFCEEYLEKNI